MDSGVRVAIGVACAAVGGGAWVAIGNACVGGGVGVVGVGISPPSEPQAATTSAANTPSIAIIPNRFTPSPFPSAS